MLPGQKTLPIHVEKAYKTSKGEWSGLGKAHPQIDPLVYDIVEKEYTKKTISFRKVKLTDWERENYQAPEGFQPIDIELEAVRQLYGTDSLEYEQAVIRKKLADGEPIFDRDIEYEHKQEQLRRHFGELDCSWDVINRKEIQRRNRQVELTGDFEPDWQFELDDNCDPLTKPSNRKKIWFDPWKEPDKFNKWLNGESPLQEDTPRRKGEDPSYVAKNYEWHFLVQLEEFRFWQVYDENKKPMKLFGASFRESKDKSLGFHLFKFINEVKEAVDTCSDNLQIRGLNRLPWNQYSVICLYEIPQSFKDNNHHIFLNKNFNKAKYFCFEVVGNPFVIQSLIEEMNTRLESFRNKFYDFTKGGNENDEFKYRIWEELGDAMPVASFPKRYKPKCKVCGSTIPALRLAHAKWSYREGISGSDIQNPFNTIVHKCVKKVAQANLEHTVTLYSKNGKYYTKASVPYEYIKLVEENKDPSEFGWRVLKMIRLKNYKTGKFIYKKPTVKSVKLVHCDGSDVELVTNNDITG